MPKKKVKIIQICVVPAGGSIFVGVWPPAMLALDSSGQMWGWVMKGEGNSPENPVWEKIKSPLETK